MPLYQFHGMKSHLDVELEMPVQRVKRKLLQQPDCECEMVTEEVDSMAKRQRWDSAENNNIFGPGHVNHLLSSELTATFNQVPLDGQGDVGWQKGVPAFDSLQLPGNLLHRSYAPQPQTMHMEEQRLQPVDNSDGAMNNGVEESDTVMECSDHPALFEDRVEYCSNPCTGGTRSPVSNRIRCSCRSYNIVDETPYCSDYY